MQFGKARRVYGSQKQPTSYAMDHLPIEESDILMEEAGWLVLYKPAGLLTQAAPGVPSVQMALELLLARRPSAPEHPFVGLPHRLDRGTSGALLVARNARTLRRFGDQFAHRLVEKSYLAMVEGDATGKTGRWEDHVRKIPERPVGETVNADHPDAKLAVLESRLCWTDGSRSLIEVHLETGRMHQIRIQCSARGLPVVGDWCYQATSRFGTPDSQGLWQQLALHAWRLSFRHPGNAKKITAQADLPSSWKVFPCDALRQLDDSQLP
jgi:23S rRNA pseudouridine1911/1915/1917 synthase